MPLGVLDRAAAIDREAVHDNTIAGIGVSSCSELDWPSSRSSYCLATAARDRVPALEKSITPAISPKFGTDAARDCARPCHQPSIALQEFVTPNSAIYVASPAGSGRISLRSSLRDVWRLPCPVCDSAMNEVIDHPRHHVHAAAVPIVFWSAAAGLGTASWISGGSLGMDRGRSANFPRKKKRSANWFARFAVLSALCRLAFSSCLSPLSIRFRDPDFDDYWRIALHCRKTVPNCSRGSWIKFPSLPSIAAWPRPISSIRIHALCAIVRLQRLPKGGERSGASRAFLRTPTTS